MVEVTAGEIVGFWLEEVGPAKWYVQEDTLDAEIRERFLPVWEAAFNGEMYEWCQDAETILAFLILTDQFPRNMFRGDPRSYATDVLARTAAKMAVHRRWDMGVPQPERQFFYMPLMHSENLGDQDACIRLMSERMPENREMHVLHAKVHREIVRRYGRFPYRNAALGRMTLPAEQAFLDGDGYRGVLRELEEAE